MYHYRSPPASNINTFDQYDQYDQYYPSKQSALIDSPSPTYASLNISRMSSITSTSTTSVAQRTSTWQDKLQEHCQSRRLPLPAYNVLSDRRGKRTAWSCTVSVSGQNVPARYWYDGQYVNTAKEDAAEAALQKLQGKSGGGGVSERGRVVGWGR